MSKKQSKGRQKVEMVKMTKDSNLQVTFSKRRAGLFKKASELCTLCGAEVAIVVFSPGNKVFSFGHPDVEAVIDRYLTRNPPQTSGAMQLIEAHRNANVQELNMQLTEVTNQLEVEKKRGEELNEMMKASQEQCWWQSPIEELSLPQLLQLKHAMEELRKKVKKQAEHILIQTSNSQQFFMGSSSSSSAGPAGMMNMNMNMNMPNYQLPNNNINPNMAFDHANMNIPPGFNPNIPMPMPMPMPMPDQGYNNPNIIQGYNPNINPGFF